MNDDESSKSEAAKIDQWISLKVNLRLLQRFIYFMTEPSV